MTGDARDRSNPEPGLQAALAEGDTRVIDPITDVPLAPARYREMFESSPMGIIVSTLCGRIVQTNASLDELLGRVPGELLGTELNELFMPTELPIIEERYHRVRSGQDLRVRVRSQLRGKNDEPVWVHLAVSALLDAKQQPQYLATMVDDVTELHMLKEWLSRQTLYDLQTGLPNRQYFVSHLERVLGRLAPSAVITLLHLDLDGFSAVADGLGRRFGDQLLDTVARRLRMVVADQRAMVARFGGDEFVILIEPAKSSAPEVGALAEAINTELEEPIYLDEMGVAVTASIGIVQQRVGKTEHAELLRAAGTTLRRLRGNSTRQWAVFDADIDTIRRTEQQLAATMPGALETGRLRVEYQPVVTLEGHRMAGIEAVLTWPHPQLGVLSHERCMRIAEQTGVVHATGQWLLRSAASQAVAWRQRFGAGVPPIMIDLSPYLAQDPDLVAKVKVVLDQTGLPAAALDLRMPTAAIRTDTGVLTEGGGAEAEDNLRVLAELGVRTGLYNFGGGIGGLRCLAELPVCAVRIARPIARQVADDPSRILSQAVHALVHIVRAAEIDVIAHPVDSPEQAGCWRWVGANWAVGTLFGPPGPPENIESLIGSPADP